MISLRLLGKTFDTHFNSDKLIPLNAWPHDDGTNPPEYTPTPKCERDVRENRWASLSEQDVLLGTQYVAETSTSAIRCLVTRTSAANPNKNGRLGRQRLPDMRMVEGHFSNEKNHNTKIQEGSATAMRTPIQGRDCKLCFGYEHAKSCCGHMCSLRCRRPDPALPGTSPVKNKEGECVVTPFC